MNFSLDGSAKSELRKASRNGLDDCLKALGAAGGNRRWIRKGNRYRLACGERYSDDARRHTVNEGHLREYVAASGPAHVVDGWSLLGRALDSAIRRDTYAAVHFAYYAELRAAMALLACEGIGVFNRKHAVVSPTRTIPLSKSPGTHELAHLAIKHWSELARAASLLDEIVAPGGIGFSRWLEACHVTAPLRAIGKKWLRSWGLDLAVLSDDKGLRNLASYRPSLFRLPPPIKQADLVEFFQQLWRLLEPSPVGRFPSLELHLLRKALRVAGVSTPTPANLTTLGLSEEEARDWVSLLTSNGEPLPLAEADRQTTIENPRCHLQVISRASLLLYVATRAAGRLLSKSGCTRDSLSFWWHGFGDTRGFLDASSLPESPLDTWADVETALQDLGAVRTDGLTFRAFRLNHSRALAELGACDMIAVWGLVP